MPLIPFLRRDPLVGSAHQDRMIDRLSAGTTSVPLRPVGAIHELPLPVFAPNISHV
ncbi:hypothetical protein THTE_0123 [Thermogutta terrifontis]|uniref:Uncharacterized protein n=1 Tax=Thermogutta terrifontis TaxID=1331910 RepID=A0A286R9T2_9BACT|nr:hypothetical protein THTE_0123 [Thermogutta terrifontis]